MKIPLGQMHEIGICDSFDADEEEISAKFAEYSSIN